MEIGPEAEEKENRIVCHGFGDLVARFVRKFNQDEPGDFSMLQAAVHSFDAQCTFFVTNTDEGIRVQVDRLMRGDVTAEMTAEMISQGLTTEMSIDEFLELHGGPYGIT